ncbi:MAG: SDR family NAD(P)-dependent oxidoreductase [Phototrophicaceae bacterium]
MSVSGKVAIVTGAARGIGAATAVQLAADGASVALLDIDYEETEQVAATLRQNGHNAQVFVVDLSDVPKIDGVVAEVVKTFGRVDILVNNAGICPRIPLDEMTVEWFDRIVNINMRSVFFMTRAVANDMKKRRWGRIVNISSTGGRIGGVHNSTVYSATKGAVLSMTKSMAREYAADGILINSIAPGAVETRMFDIDPEAKQAYIETVPLRRLADPSELAVSIVQLCSSEMTWVTGATLDVNGGVVMV